MARTVYELEQRRVLIGAEIAANLDLLIGSISTKGPRRPGFNLTFKVDGVTRSRHIRREDMERVRLMIDRHRKIKVLIQKLSDLNWRILTLQSE